MSDETDLVTMLEGIKRQAFESGDNYAYVTIELVDQTLSKLRALPVVPQDDGKDYLGMLGIFIDQSLHYKNITPSQAEFLREIYDGLRGSARALGITEDGNA